jgi:hypothetical protein
MKAIFNGITIAQSDDTIVVEVTTTSRWRASIQMSCEPAG